MSVKAALAPAVRTRRAAVMCLYNIAKSLDSSSYKRDTHMQTLWSRARARARSPMSLLDLRTETPTRRTDALLADGVHQQRAGAPPLAR